MDEELKQLKSVLRSLVVSSPTQVDMRSLLRDYRSMIGKQIPMAKYGYNNPATFLREHFSDCFLGSAGNPELTLIVPDALKHIDKFVQKQKTASNAKFKGKRRSVPEKAVKPVESNLIVKSLTSKKIDSDSKETVLKVTQGNKQSKGKQILQKSVAPVQSKEIMNENRSDNSTYSQTVLQNFLKKRTALYSSQCSLSENSFNDRESFKEDNDSGKQTSSSSSSSKKMQLEELKREIKDIIVSHSDGVWCTDLLRLYRERYGRELNFSRFGYTSVLSIACAVSDVRVLQQPDGDWRLSDERAAAARPPAPRALPARAPRALPADPDDALPGIAFEADVFPEDCMHFLESIPSASLADIKPGTMLEVIIGEVYSPSHFWLLRLGDQYNIAMEDMMDEMNQYYTRGEGAKRALLLGAARPGHYCCSCYEGDWHRSLIVKVIDSDTVKVRHVDYGTVERCEVRALRPLLRRWALLEAQAVRARLSGVRPPAAGRRWPRPAAHHFLRLVRDTRLVANVVAVDAADDALEVLLIDTTTRDDRCVAAELVRAGHADARADLTLATSECYLYPRFEVLENGDTPNFAEIHAYLRDGIALECVEDYRRHVPPCLPDEPPARPPSPPASPPPKPCARLAPRCSRATPLARPQPESASAPAFFPAPGFAPAFVPTPWPYHYEPEQWWSRGVISLPAAECKEFAMLSRLDPSAAHRFMLGAVSRAMCLSVGSTLNPHAPEFRMVPAQTQTDATLIPENHPHPRPTTGFKNS